MSPCNFFRVACSCGRYTCRILHLNEKKLTQEQMIICHSDDYETECLRYEVGVEHYKKLAEAKK